MRIRALVLAAAFLVGILWLVYGTLHPCTMLRQDLRAALTKAPPSPDLVQRWTRALGTALLDPVLDLALRDRSPAACVRDLVRLHTGTRPEDLLPPR
jgi:hypothetical protein